MATRSSGPTAGLSLAIVAIVVAACVFCWYVGGYFAFVAALGFVWWEALPVLHQRYWDGVQRNRPSSYWWWGNLGALVASAGPVSWS